MHVQKLSDNLSRLMSRTGRESSQTEPLDEQPLREELFSVDQLERHAMSIAASHQLAPDRARDKLLPRLAENERVLVETYDLMAEASLKNRRIEPAGEWLLDNFYLIEEQIRSIRRLLPPSYSRELPRLASGSAAGFPRTYGISLELIAHVDGRVESRSLIEIVARSILETRFEVEKVQIAESKRLLSLLETQRKKLLSRNLSGSISDELFDQQQSEYDGQERRLREQMARQERIGQSVESACGQAGHVFDVLTNEWLQMERRARQLALSALCGGFRLEGRTLVPENGTRLELFRAG